MQFEACGATSKSYGCLSLDKEYQVRVQCFLGPTAYSSDIISILPTSSALASSSVVVTATNSSVHVDWSSSEEVGASEYEIWVQAGDTHNGYEDADSVTYWQELVQADGERLQVAGSVRSVEVSGCLVAAGSGEQVCVSAWTYYRVHVFAVVGPTRGKPATGSVRTAAGTPQAVQDVVVQDVQSSNMEVGWRHEQAVGPVRVFRIAVTEGSSDGVETADV